MDPTVSISFFLSLSFFFSLHLWIFSFCFSFLTSPHPAMFANVLTSTFSAARLRLNTSSRPDPFVRPVPATAVATAAAAAAPHQDTHPLPSSLRIPFSLVVVIPSSHRAPLGYICPRRVRLRVVVMLDTVNSPRKKPLPVCKPVCMPLRDCTLHIVAAIKRFRSLARARTDDDQTVNIANISQSAGHVCVFARVPIKVSYRTCTIGLRLFAYFFFFCCQIKKSGWGRDDCIELGERVDETRCKTNSVSKICLLSQM